MIKLNRKLDDWINSFMEFTENSEPPEAFRFWTAVSVLASALQRKCFIQWGSSLIFYPNLYIVLVGPSGVRKGTAMDPGFDLIEDIGKIKVSAQATSLQALIRRIKETNYQDPDLNTGKMQFHSSMTIFSKEFTVFLGYHNKELMSSLCDWYDCDRKWAYETIARKKEEIVGVWVNLFGATTPSLIRSSLPLDAIGGGLTSRIIYIYEEKMGKMVLLPMETENEKKLRKLLLHDLDKITLLSGQFKYTKGFLGLWSEWRVETEKRPPFYDDRFDGYISRRPNHIMKLSMIMSVSKGSDKNQMTLTTADLQRAIATLEKAELKMQGVFSGLGRSDTADILQRVITYLKLSKTDEIPMWQLARSFRNDMDKLLMDRIIATLEAMKFAKIIHKPQADDVIRILDRNI
jgi:hypothetical protein